eukprot:SAG11_NODE_23247_length_392_cov_0.986348_2_plen_67_part_01
MGNGRLHCSLLSNSSIGPEKSFGFTRPSSAACNFEFVRRRGTSMFLQVYHSFVLVHIATLKRNCIAA